MAPADNFERGTDRQSLLRTGLFGALLVAVTLGLASALAYQAARAASSHRYAVEAALSHHATTAAWRFAREARGWVGWGMNESADVLQRELGARPKLPGPDILTQLFADKYCDCVTAAFGRTFVRLVAEKGSWGNRIEILGEPLSQRTADSRRG